MRKFIVIIWLLMFSLSITMAQEPISPELQTQLDTIETSTSSIRQLDRLESTDLTFPTVEELEVYLREQFDEEFTTDEFADDLLFYVGLDLMEPDIDLEAVLFDFLLDQVAGFYDPELNSMNVILLSGETPEDSLPILERITYSHEYVHALQDQYFDLEVLIDRVDLSENGDFQLAVTALIEGDATHVMTDYTVELAEDDPLALAQAMLSAGSELGGVSLPEGVPPIIESELIFPYIQGQVFIAHIVNEKGWDAVNDAFNGNLPASTEHIYHPETYLAGELPIDVSVPDMTDVLGSNWRLAQDTPVGEFYLREYLGTQLSGSIVRDMATGWGGDRMHLYTDDATGEIIWALYQVWDTPEDAAEFAEGYIEFLDLRFDASSPDSTCWSGDDSICFAIINDTETRISYAMNSELALALLTYAD